MMARSHPHHSAGYRVVFLDLDGTVWAGVASIAFERFFVSATETGNGEASASPEGLDQALRRIQTTSSFDRPRANRELHLRFRGRNLIRTSAIADEWAVQISARLPAGLIESTARLVQQLRDAGYSPVIVSGSWERLVRPFAAHIGATAILATRLVVRSGVFTGQIIGPQCIGRGKATRIKSFARSNGLDLGLCAAVGDHASDLDMLNAVRGPRAVVGRDPVLTSIARAEGWAILPTRGEAR